MKAELKFHRGDELMKKLLVLVCVLAAGAGPVRAQKAGGFGAGAIVGNPTGGTAKFWIDENNALDAGVGFSTKLAVYGDYLWHAWNLLPQPSEGKLPLYLGVGIQVRTFSTNESGIRAVVGVDYWMPRNPVEFFFEIVPVFRFSPGNSVGLDAGIGVRYYFTGS